ncbi:hypothetical protein [Labrys neptuniae]|uniref:Uncharacterized protein n=1 Tax=Labrys neptuniae TaxID=376174 RepID=A0ABV3PG39_9HYPH
MGQKLDSRRTLPPDDSSIVVDAEGFSLICEGEAVYRVDWQRVHQIAGYTRFRDLKPELCLAFAFSRRQRDQVVVHNDVPGWDRLCAALAVSFPGADPDWRSKAAHDVDAPESYAPVGSVVPIFTVNPTIVWAK